jgi:hypothetical protein
MVVENDLIVGSRHVDRPTCHGYRMPCTTIIIQGQYVWVRASRRGRIAVAVFGVLVGSGAIALAFSTRGGGSPTSIGASTTTSTRAIGPRGCTIDPFPAGVCSRAQLVAAWTRVFQLSGATSTEASCLAPIMARHDQQAAAPIEPTAAEMRAFDRCVRSEARRVEVATALVAYMGKHPLAGG